jgi:hypothetical protein
MNVALVGITGEAFKRYRAFVKDDVHWRVAARIPTAIRGYSRSRRIFRPGTATGCIRLFQG